MGSQLSFPEVNIEGRNVIVTGANTGIGYVTAKTLARMGGRVTVACRSEEKGLEAIEQMKKELDGMNPHLSFARLDLSSLQQTGEFVADYCAKNEHLHLLVLNAGCSLPAKLTTGDGYSMQYQVNFLSHLLMTLMFVPMLRKTADAMQAAAAAAIKDEASSGGDASSASKGKSPPTAEAAEGEATSATGAAEAPSSTDGSSQDSPPRKGPRKGKTKAKSTELVPASNEVRVVSVSSQGHTVKKYELDLRVDTERNEDRLFKLYCLSKLYQVMATQALARHFHHPGLAFHSLHPGMVKTSITRDMEGFWKTFTSVMNFTGQLRTPEQGACTTLSCCLDSQWDGIGTTYFDSCKPKTISRDAQNVEFQAEVWNVALSQLEAYLQDVPGLEIDWSEVKAAAARSLSTEAAASAATAAAAPGEQAPVDDNAATATEATPTADALTQPAADVATVSENTEADPKAEQMKQTAASVSNETETSAETAPAPESSSPERAASSVVDATMGEEAKEVDTEPASAASPRADGEPEAEAADAGAASAEASAE